MPPTDTKKSLFSWYYCSIPSPTMQYILRKVFVKKKRYEKLTGRIQDFSPASFSCLFCFRRVCSGFFAAFPHYMLAAGFQGVNPGGVHTAVSQQISQADNVLFQAVERSGEQVPQIVGEYLFRGYPVPLAQGFHIPPDIASVQRLSMYGLGTARDQGWKESGVP